MSLAIAQVSSSAKAWRRAAWRDCAALPSCHRRLRSLQEGALPSSNAYGCADHSFALLPGYRFHQLPTFTDACPDHRLVCPMSDYHRRSAAHRRRQQVSVPALPDRYRWPVWLTFVTFQRNFIEDRPFPYWCVPQQTSFCSLPASGPGSKAPCRRSSPPFQLPSRPFCLFIIVKRCAQLKVARRRFTVNIHAAHAYAIAVITSRLLRSSLCVSTAAIVVCQNRLRSCRKIPAVSAVTSMARSARLIYLAIFHRQRSPACHAISRACHRRHQQSAHCGLPPVTKLCFGVIRRSAITEVVIAMNIVVITLC